MSSAIDNEVFPVHQIPTPLNCCVREIDWGYEPAKVAPIGRSYMSASDPGYEDSDGDVRK